MEDPHVMQDALRMLFEAESEFPIKVEGTSTLPYTSRIQGLDFANGQFTLRLARPLPHEMMGGALFRIVFAVEDQRFEGLITFIGREAYLQYRFQLPTHLIHADRRRHKRFPFRPRENAYVIAQDSGIPGMGLAGPLVNISQGGFALRVDRVLKLDDGMRLPPNTALFGWRRWAICPSSSSARTWTPPCCWPRRPGPGSSPTTSPTKAAGSAPSTPSSNKKKQDRVPNMGPSGVNQPLHLQTNPHPTIHREQVELLLDENRELHFEFNDRLMRFAHFSAGAEGLARAFTEEW